MIDYRYGFENELNTFNDTFKKDLADHGSIKIKFQLSEAEQDEIINKALAVEFFQLPDTLPIVRTNTNEPAVSKIVKSEVQFLRIKYKNLNKKVIWFGALPYNNSNYKGLIELTALIKSAIESKPEYKALPGMNSGDLRYFFKIVKLLF